MVTFGEKIKELRKEKHITQKDMANALSITVSTLSHWECDYQEPSFKDVSRLADFFGCSVDYLLGREDDFGNVATPGAELPADEQELLANFRTLPREEKVQARSYVRYLAERRAPGNKHA